MLIDITFSTFGKYLLLSGEVAWGITPLVSMQNSLLYLISDGEYSPVSGLYSAPRAQTVPLGGLSASYDYTTGYTNLYASVVPCYFDSAASADSGFVVGALTTTLSSARLRALAYITFHATPSDSVAMGSTLYAMPTGGLIASI